VPNQKLLNHNLRARFAKAAAEHIRQRGLSLFNGVSDHNALARGQSVGLQHVGRGEIVECGARLC